MSNKLYYFCIFDKTTLKYFSVSTSVKHDFTHNNTLIFTEHTKLTYLIHSPLFCRSMK